MFMRPKSAGREGGGRSYTAGSGQSGDVRQVAPKPLAGPAASAVWCLAGCAPRTRAGFWNGSDVRVSRRALTCPEQRIHSVSASQDLQMAAYTYASKPPRSKLAPAVTQRFWASLGPNWPEQQRPPVPYIRPS